MADNFDLPAEYLFGRTASLYANDETEQPNTTSIYEQEIPWNTHSGTMPLITLQPHIGSHVGRDAGEDGETVGGLLLHGGHRIAKDSFSLNPNQDKLSVNGSLQRRSILKLSQSVPILFHCLRHLPYKTSAKLMYK